MDRKIKRNIIIACILSACCVVAAIMLMMPSVQNALLALGEKLKSGEIRRPEKWITQMRVISTGFFVIAALWYASFCLPHTPITERIQHDERLRNARVSLGNVVIAFGNKKKSFLLLYCFYALVTISFIFSPVTGDIKVFLAGARQADFLSGNFIQNVYNQWELKGVLNRMTFYILYKLTGIFCEFPSVTFERFVAFFYFFFSTGILFLTSHLFTPKKTMMQKIRLTVMLSFAVFCVQIMSRMQAEMSVCIILLLGFSLYVNAELTKKHESIKIFVAGLLIGITVFFKTVLILLSVAFVASCYIWDKKNDVKPTVRKFFLLFTGGLLSLTIGFISIILINPQEIQNILNASLFQSTLFSGGRRSFKGVIVSFCYGYLNSAVGAPFILLGLIVTLCMTSEYVRLKKFDCLAMEVVVWTIPSLIIILANCYFHYHFYILSLPALLNLYLYSDKIKSVNDEKKRGCIFIGFVATLLVSIFFQIWFLYLYSSLMNKLMLLFVILIFVCTFAVQFKKFKKLTFIVIEFVPFVFGMFCIFSYLTLFSKNTKVYSNLTKQVFAMNDGLDFDHTKTILYLDDGSGAYHLGNKSYSNYYFPLPLQRIYDSSEEAKSEFYQSVEEHFLAFNGNYVSVQADWFFSNGNNTQLKQKLSVEYEKRFVVYRFSVPQNLFVDLREQQPTTMDFYRRKQ